MTNQNKAYICTIAVVLIWSTIATAFKLTLKHLDFLQMLLYSSLASTLALFVILTIQGKLKLFKEYTIRDYISSALLGFLNPFLYYLVLFKAYELLPAQQAQPLNNIWPITLVILSIILLRQRITFKSIAALMIAFTGVVIISTKGSFVSFKDSDPLGIILALGSSIIWAFYWIYNTKDKRDETSKLFLNFCFGLIYILTINLLSTDMKLPSTSGLVGSAYIGLFEMGITFVLWLTALRLSTTTAQVSILIYLSPAMSLIFIWLVLKESIHPATIIGFVLIVMGIVIQQKKPPINRDKSQ